MVQISETSEWCPISGQKCAFDGICAIFFCARGRDLRLRPVTFGKLWLLADVPLDALKAAWDKLGSEDDNYGDGMFIDDIYAELNRRGEGSHCAI
jgi:hypothetical protein